MLVEPDLDLRAGDGEQRDDRIRLRPVGRALVDEAEDEDPLDGTRIREVDEQVLAAFARERNGRLGERRDGRAEGVDVAKLEIPFDEDERRSCFRMPDLDHRGGGRGDGAEQEKGDADATHEEPPRLR